VVDHAPRLTLVQGTGPTDGALCRAFAAGDDAAFATLIGRHQDTVLRLVRRYARSNDDARDLAQRAFLQAWEAARRALPKLGRDERDDVPFRAWLLRIAINLGKNHLRDGARWTRSPVEAIDRRLAPADAESRAPDVALERAQAEALTRRAVLGLPRRQREVFGLRIDGGLSFAEVAQTLGITEGNAKAHFHHAVKRLREDVQGWLNQQVTT
jgi:RNA polymerase sigma-70 factor (ECF subfamily)